MSRAGEEVTTKRFYASEFEGRESWKPDPDAYDQCVKDRGTYFQRRKTRVWKVISAISIGCWMCVAMVCLLSLGVLFLAG